MITYVLSGPMTGYPDFNYPLFFEVEAGLVQWLRADGGPEAEAHRDGFEILNPARHFDGDQTRAYSEYMQAALEDVLRADVVVLLPGWLVSTGCDHEVNVAKWTGKRFLHAVFDGSGWEFIAVPELDTASLPSGLPVDDGGFIASMSIEQFAPSTASADPISPRASALDEARGLITGDRNNAYGPPTQDFQRAAAILNAMEYRGKDRRPIEPHDIALMVMAVKMSRLVWTPGKRDSWVDIAGYAGCGYECAVEEEEAF